MYSRTAPLFFITFILVNSATATLFIDEDAQCPLEEVPFLEEATGRPRHCSAVVHCPIGYSCYRGTVCCGKPGQCPSGRTIVTDTTGRYLICSPSGLPSCPSGSICSPSTTVSQHLCCVPPTDFSSQQQIATWSGCVNCQFSRAGSCNNMPCPLNNLYSRRIFCCQSSGIRRTAAVSCADKKRSIEMLPDGRARKCTKRNPICSTGYSCQESTRTGTMLCCSLARNSATYRCPSANQTPALSGSNNIFCTKPGQTYVCPAGAICQTVANSPGLHICCYGRRMIPQQLTSKPECPDGKTAQSGSNNGFVPCSRNSEVNECAPGYTCVQAANVQSQNLCCSEKVAVQQLPTCPGQQNLLMSGKEPYYCTPNEPVPCPEKYDCSEAINLPDTYICCTAPAPTGCPSDFMPSLDADGKQIYCTPNDPATCPGSAACMESVADNAIYLCCYSSLPRKVCPDDQDALILSSGEVEVCAGTSSKCSQSGYTCQVSPELSTWVCCGHPAAMAVCADGRETFYQIEGQTYVCKPTSQPTNCPVNYECAPSNIQGTSVCCLISAVTTTSSTTTTPTTTTTGRPQCPARWSPFIDYQTGGNQYCNNVVDRSCPTGFSCAQSTHYGIHMCCRLGSSLRCASGLRTLLVNNRPRLCSTATSNICPVGYSCQLSNFANVRVCCSNMEAQDQQSMAPSFNTDIRCQYDLSLPAVIHNHYVRFCPTVGAFNGCPEGYICSSSNRKNLNVCCRSTSRSLVIKVEPEEAVCGEKGSAYQHNGLPLECSQDADTCPEHYVCQPSLTNTKMYCCLEELHCPSGVTPGPRRKCVVSADCPLDEECQEAENEKDVRICCPAAIQEVTRCVGRETFLTDANPAACLTAASCPTDYECSNLTTTSEYACCKEEKKQIQICPDNRDPYRRFADDALLYCDDTDFACPNGYLCKQSLLNDRFICCSPIGFCQPGRKPQLDDNTNQPKRCFSESDETTANSTVCLQGFTCQQSTVKYIRVCCSSNSSSNP